MVSMITAKLKSRTTFLIWSFLGLTEEFRELLYPPMKCRKWSEMAKMTKMTFCSSNDRRVRETPFSHSYAISRV